MDKTAAAKPVLNKIWWDKNKAKTLLKTGVGKSLLDFEMALDKALKGSKPADEEKTVQKAATDAKKIMIAARGKANSKLHAETIVALTNMEKLLDDEVKKSAERAKRVPVAVPVAATGGGGPVVIFGMSVAKEVLQKNKSTWVKGIQGWDMSLGIDANTVKVLVTEDDGPLFQQMMRDEAKNVFDATVDAIVKYIENVDKGAERVTEDKVDLARQKLNDYAQQQVAAAKPKLEAIPQQVFDDFKKKHKQYLKYQVKAAVKITQGTASVALSAAALVGSHGASLALSIVGIIRGTADIVKTIYDLALAADTVGKELAKDVDTLTKQYYDAAGEIQRARQVSTEITGSVLKSVLGTDCPFLITLPKVSANYELWDNKIAGVNVEGGKLSGRIVRILEESDKLEKKLANAQGPTAKKVYNDLIKIRAGLDKVLEKNHAVMAQADRFNTNSPKLKAQIDLMNKDNTTLAKVFDVMAPLVVNLGLSVGGTTLDFKAAETASEIVKTTLTFANDIEAIGQSTLESAIGK